MTIYELLKTLTPAQAKAWAEDPEQWLHVTDNYLDPAGLRRTKRTFWQLKAGSWKSSTIKTVALLSEVYIISCVE